MNADTSRGEALAASLSESWVNHKPLSLLLRFCLLSGSIFILFGPGLVLLFIECKQKMLLSWNRVFAAKSRWGVNDLWGLWHLASLLTLINKSLFVNNLHNFLYFTHIFWEMRPWNLNFLGKKDQCSPSNIWSNL